PYPLAHPSSESDNWLCAKLGSKSVQHRRKWVDTQSVNSLR
ncbi:16025_t:CDS:1, partial [Acaulospora colombiana]